MFIQNNINITYILHRLVDVLSIQYGVTTIDQTSNATNKIPVSKYTVHPDYKPGNGFINDIAILEVKYYSISVF